MPIICNLITLENGKPRYDNPKFCHSCGSIEIVLFRNNDDERNRHGVWCCYTCNARVGAHADGRPLGYMAHHDIRALRYKFHLSMDRLLHQGYTYDEICSYLQARLDIDADYLHSAWLTKGELSLSIATMDERAKRPKKNRPYNARQERERRKSDKDKLSTLQRKKSQGKFTYKHAGYRKSA